LVLSARADRQPTEEVMATYITASSAKGAFKGIG